MLNRTIVKVSLLSIIIAVVVAAAAATQNSRNNGMDNAPKSRSLDPNSFGKEKGREVATFAAGCFWGVETAFREVKGVTNTMVGYTGGHIDNPTYKALCSNTTGHAEALLVEYDPNQVTYEKLLFVFWHIHNPTTLNRQGPDVGSQYRSAVFYHSDLQKQLALESMRNRQKQLKRKIVTQVVPAATFWPAEEYHQRYFEKTGRGACHISPPDLLGQ